MCIYIYVYIYIYIYIYIYVYLCVGDPMIFLAPVKPESEAQDSSTSLEDHQKISIESPLIPGWWFGT